MGRCCSQCNEIKPPGEFYRQKQGRDGLTAACKECTRARVKRFAHSPHGHSTIAAYRASEAYRAARLKYENSEHGKAARKKKNNSPAHRAACAKYLASVKGHAMQARARRTPGRMAYMRAYMQRQIDSLHPTYVMAQLAKGVPPEGRKFLKYLVKIKTIELKGQRICRDLKTLTKRG